MTSDTFEYPPAAPQTVEETGLSEDFLIDLCLKAMYRRGLSSVTEVSAVVRLSGLLVSDLFETIRSEKLVHTLGKLGGDMRAEMRYELTTSGRARAIEAFARADYVGPCPVPLELFRKIVEAQSVKDRRISEGELKAAFGNLVIPAGLVDRLGPAVNSGRSILMYGPPGNGKSSYAHALARAMEGAILAPFAIYVEGDIVLYFDYTVHRPIGGLQDPDRDELYTAGVTDMRFVHCTRPAVVTGAELTVDMLNLQYNATSRVYQAPVQLKASNGVFIIDDMGRQSETPQAFINRMIVPMEEGVDYLNLVSGLSFQVPFDTLLIFSTNIDPTELVDGAGLRRIYYKLLIDRPSREDFLKIFLRVCAKFEIEPKEEVLAHLINELYGNSSVQFSAYQAPYLIDQTLAACDYHGVDRELRIDFLEDAWDNLYVDDSV